MKFTPTHIEGAWLVGLERRQDDRGFFARAMCRDEFASHGLNPAISQCNVGFTHAAATLRGLHYQTAPHEEAKLVRCTAGAVFDVVVDLRPSSPTFRQWFGATLTADNHDMLYVPEGCAHGYLTLEDHSEVFYQVSSPYVPAAERGARWNDPAFGIRWPIEPKIIHPRDQSYPDFQS